MKKTTENKKAKLRKVQLRFGILLIMLFANIPMFAYAAQPKIVSGTILLLQTATQWIMILAPIAGGLFGGYHAIRKSMSDDEMEIKKHQNMIKNSIIGVVMAISISGIISFVSGFYS